MAKYEKIPESRADTYYLANEANYKKYQAEDDEILKRLQEIRGEQNRLSSSDEDQKKWDDLKSEAEELLGKRAKIVKLKEYFAEKIGVGPHTGAPIHRAQQPQQGEGEQDGGEAKKAIKAELIDYAPAETDMKKEFADIAGESAALLKAAEYRPELIPVIKQTEWFNAQSDLYNATKKYAENYLGLLDTLGLSPDLAKGKEHAKGYISQPQVSRESLDELQRRGPVQMEEPEIPSMWNAATQMLLGTIAQAFQTANQSALAAAESEQAATGVAMNSAAYQAAEFASFKQNRQRVLEINTQLRAQYQGDLIAAMRDYEKRADAAQWNYEQQLITAALNEQRQYYDIFGKAKDFDIAAEQIKADINTKYLQHEANVKKANVQSMNEAKRFSAGLRLKIMEDTFRKISDLQRFQQKLLENNMGFYGEKLAKGAGMMSAANGSGGMLYSDVMKVFHKYDMTPGGPNAQMAQVHSAALKAFLNNAQNKIAAMYADEEDELKRRTAFGNLVSNIQLLNHNGWALRYTDVSDTTFNTLISRPLTTTLLTPNIEKGGLSEDDFITPDSVGAERQAWLERYTDLVPFALNEIMYERYQMAGSRQPQIQSFAPALPEE